MRRSGSLWNSFALSPAVHRSESGDGLAAPQRSPGARSYSVSIASPGTLAEERGVASARRCSPCPVGLDLSTPFVSRRRTLRLDHGWNFTLWVSACRWDQNDRQPSSKASRRLVGADPTRQPFGSRASDLPLRGEGTITNASHQSGLSGDGALQAKCGPRVCMLIAHPTRAYRRAIVRVVVEPSSQGGFTGERPGRVGARISERDRLRRGRWPGAPSRSGWPRFCVRLTSRWT